MLAPSRYFRGPWSKFVVLAGFCAGMIYVSSCSQGSGLSRSDPPTIKEAHTITSQQEHRRIIARRGCLEIANKRGDTNRGLNTQHLIVDDNLKIIYCYVPKAASTNWKRVLLSLRDPRQTPLSIQPDVGHKREWEVIANLEDKRLTDRNYFKFLVVRNPFERLLSAYRNKFELAYSDYFRGRYGRSMKYHHEKRRFSPDASRDDGIPSFLDFLSYVSSDNSEKNEHWQSVYDICHPCDIMFDFIGKYETLQRDSDFIVDHISSSGKIDRDWSFPSREETYTRKQPTRELMELYYRSIPEALRDKLSKSFEEDISLFGYSRLSLRESSEKNTPSNSSESDKRIRPMIMAKQRQN